MRQHDFSPRLSRHIGRNFLNNTLPEYIYWDGEQVFIGIEAANAWEQRQ